LALLKQVLLQSFLLHLQQKHLKIIKMSEEKQKLILENFGPIKKAEVEFGDLTVLVGPQATGKSVFLQMYKWQYDAQLILSYYTSNGRFVWPENLMQMFRLYFGKAAETLLSDFSKVNNEQIHLAVDSKEGISVAVENVVYVPANRDQIFFNNYPRDSNYDFPITEPYVLRSISGLMNHFLFTRFNNLGLLSTLNRDNKFWGSNPIYYNDEPFIKVENQQRKLALKIQKKEIVYNDWSTGQKAYLPIAATLDLMKSWNWETNPAKEKIIVIEEPELGLHPKAIQEFLLQIFSMLKLGFRVVLSTHSDLILETMWVLNQIGTNNNDFTVLEHLFQTDNRPEFKEIFSSLTGKSFKTYYFYKEKDGDGSLSKDISSLDVFSEDPEISNWGGFMNFKDRANAVVALVNQDS